MNTYNQLNFSEKISLLLDLFPELKATVIDKVNAYQAPQFKRYIHFFGMDKNLVNSQIIHAKEIISKYKDQLLHDNALFLEHFSTIEISPIINALLNGYALEAVRQGELKKSQAIELLFLSAEQGYLFRPLSDYSIFDKMHLLFSLFPQFLYNFGLFLKEKAMQNQENPVQQYPDYRDVARMLVLILSNHLERLFADSYAFASGLIIERKAIPTLDQMKYFICQQLPSYAEQYRGMNLNFYWTVRAFF